MELFDFRHFFFFEKIFPRGQLAKGRKRYRSFYAVIGDEYKKREVIVLFYITNGKSRFSPAGGSPKVDREVLELQNMFVGAPIVVMNQTNFKTCIDGTWSAFDSVANHRHFVACVIRCFFSTNPRPRLPDNFDILNT